MGGSYKASNDVSQEVVHNKINHHGTDNHWLRSSYARNQSVKIREKKKSKKLGRYQRKFSDNSEKQKCSR